MDAPTVNQTEAVGAQADGFLDAPISERFGESFAP
jgi:hypothetical protein